MSRATQILGAVSKEEMPAIIAKMSPGDLALIAAGKDPEGGVVPDGVKKMAVDELARRSGAVPAAPGAPPAARGFPIVKTVVVGVAIYGLWRMLRGGKAE